MSTTQTTTVTTLSGEQRTGRVVERELHTDDNARPYERVVVLVDGTRFVEHRSV